MNNYNKALLGYNELCKEITNIRDNIFDVKERIISEFNSDELRHLHYSLDEMQYELKEKMVLLNENKYSLVV